MRLPRGIPIIILFILILIPFHRVITRHGYLTGIDSYLPYVEPFASAFPDAGAGPGTFACRRDGLLQTVPSKYFTQQQLKEGRLPLWNPYIFCGTPHQADMYSQVFAITDTPLLYFMSVDAALTVAAILKLLILALGMYLVARRFAIRWEFACISAIAMVFNFQQMQWLEIPAFLSTSLYLPWMFLAWDKFLSSKRYPFLFLCGLLGGLAGLGGQAQLFITIWIILLLYTLFSGKRDLRVTRISGVIGLIIAFVSSLAIAWVQFYPGLQFAALSRNPESTFSLSAHFGAISHALITGGWKQIITNIIRLFLPYAIHPPGPDFYSVYKELIIYLGILSPVVMLALWRQKRSRFTSYLWWVCLVSMLVIIFNIVVESILGVLPFTQFQNLRRMVALIFNFHMALLLPMVLQNIVANLDFRMLNRIKGVLTGLIVVFLVLFAIWISRILSSGADLSGESIILISVFYFLSFIIWSAYLIHLNIKSLAKKTFPILLLCMFFLEIWNYSSHLLIISRTVSSDLRTHVYEKMDIGEMRTGRIFRAAIPEGKQQDNFMHPNTGILLGINDAQGYNPLNLYPYRRLFSVFSTTAQTNPRYIPDFPDSYFKHKDLFQLLDVRWVASQLGETRPEYGEPAFSPYQVQDLEGLPQFREEPPTSLVRMIPDYERVSTAEFLDTLNTGKAQLLFKAYVTDGQTRSIHSTTPGLNPSLRINFINQKPGLIKFDIEGINRPGILLLSENNYPGWSVKVDNQSAELLTIDGTFMGVELDAGRHTVEFTFNPPTFRIGAIISISALVLTILLLFITASRPKSLPQ